MKNQYIVGGKRRFKTLEEALEYAKALYIRKGVFASIERI